MRSIAQMLWPHSLGLDFRLVSCLSAWSAVTKVVQRDNGFSWATIGHVGSHEGGVLLYLLSRFGKCLVDQRQASEGAGYSERNS